MPKINQSVETEIWDENGNMVSKRANKTLSWGSEPPFIKMYLNDIVYLSDLPKSYGSILYELFKYMTYAGEKDGMIIFVNGYVKENISRVLELKNTQSIDNAISKMVKGNILKRISRGTYRANPYLFGKGDWQDIARLRLEINYDEIKGRTFKSVCEFEKNEPDNGENEHRENKAS